MQSGWYDPRERRVCDPSSGPSRDYMHYFDNRRVACRRCGTVKRNGLDWLADIPFYTQRSASCAGQRCRGETINDLAHKLALVWDTVKTRAAVQAVDPKPQRRNPRADEHCY